MWCAKKRSFSQPGSSSSAYSAAGCALAVPSSTHIYAVGVGWGGGVAGEGRGGAGARGRGGAEVRKSGGAKVRRCEGAKVWCRGADLREQPLLFKARIDAARRGSLPRLS